MYLLADVAEPGGEHELHLRVDILDTVLDAKFATLYHLGYFTESLEQHFEFVGLQQSYAFEHTYVCH